MGQAQYAQISECDRTLGTFHTERGLTYIEGVHRCHTKLDSCLHAFS